MLIHCCDMVDRNSFRVNRLNLSCVVHTKISNSDCIVSGAVILSIPLLRVFVVFFGSLFGIFCFSVFLFSFSNIHLFAPVLVCCLLNIVHSTNQHHIILYSTRFIFVIQFLLALKQYIHLFFYHCCCRCVLQFAVEKNVISAVTN